MDLLKKNLICCFLFLPIFTLIHGQDFLSSGQVSSWFTFNKQVTNSGQFGVRYIPDLSYSKNFSGNHTLDAVISAKILGNGTYQSESKPDYDGDVSLYRLSSRLSGSRYEIRAGLQKINFGSASVFRPLMWFDTMDSRDPLQLTTGVYGLLGRYYFLNNANIWLWGLLGNEDPKGWELIPSAKDKPEFGGRVQVPVIAGEVGVSYHYRQLELSKILPMIPPGIKTTASENRFGFDGKWDIEVGIWLETVLTHHRNELIPYDWERAYTIGIDYTFEIGNGLNLLTEYFVLENMDDILKSGDGIQFSTISANYPLSVIDKISGIVYYDWDNKVFYRLVTMQRNYDNWSFYLLAFWNPIDYKLDFSSGESSEFSGKGIQLMVVFNY